MTLEQQTICPTCKSDYPYCTCPPMNCTCKNFTATGGHQPHCALNSHPPMTQDLKNWREDLLKAMNAPEPNKKRGRPRKHQAGVRIERIPVTKNTQEFIEALLSRVLRDIELEYENGRDAADAANRMADAIVALRKTLGIQEP